MSWTWLALALLLGGPRAAAQPSSEASALRRLDAERDAARRAVKDERDQERALMKGSEAWPLATDDERRQRLDAVDAEYRDHERRLEEGYEAAKRKIETEGNAGVRP